MSQYFIIKRQDCNHESGSLYITINGNVCADCGGYGYTERQAELEEALKDIGLLDTIIRLEGILSKLVNRGKNLR